jgi:hypothetical protein
MDVFLSSGDEATHSLKSNTPIGQKGSATDDTEDMGTASVETLVPSPIGTDAPEKTKSSVSHQVPIVPPSVGMVKSAYTSLLGSLIWSLKLIK